MSKDKKIITYALQIKKNFNSLREEPYAQQVNNSSCNIMEFG